MLKIPPNAYCLYLQVEFELFVKCMFPSLHITCALPDRLTLNFSLQIEQLNKYMNFWLPEILVHLCGIAKVVLTVDSVIVSALTIRKVFE